VRSCRGTRIERPGPGTMHPASAIEQLASPGKRFGPPA
jgi:hypothetical protein